MDTLTAECAVLAAAGAQTKRTSECAESPEWLNALIRGDYSAVLAQSRFANLTRLEQPIDTLRALVKQHLLEAVERGDAEQCLEFLGIGVAALLAYTQSNVAGPEEGDPGDGTWIQKLLKMDGEDFAAETRQPEKLLLARMVLVEPLHLKERFTAEPAASQELQIGDLTLEVEQSSGSVLDFVAERVPSWLWWAGRVVALHQQFLAHGSATLRAECTALMEALEQSMLNVADLEITLKAQLHLEMAQWELLYRRVQHAAEHLHKAETLLQVKIELSGAMGKRTVHQVDPKAQLIAQVQRSVQVIPSTASEEAPLKIGLNPEIPDVEKDVLLKPVWTEEVPFQKLTPLEQCLAWSTCDLVELGTPRDELQSWEMEPFTQLIESQPTSTFIIQTKASLARVMHERERGRTRDRALLMMEQLVESVRSGEATDRLSFVFSVRIPTILQLRKQLARMHISFGLAASALQTYEELEMWDELVLCYRLLEKKAIADEIVSRRLEADPENPNLLCTLADLRSDSQLYLRAWEASQKSYPRAQRSLARQCVEKKDYKSAAESFELALQINTLHADAWFSLGYCYLKLGNDSQALRAFTWCAQLEPENGEAWNNLGALWMRRAKPDRALWALKEAVKYKRSSWETWENYAKAGQECGEPFLAIHGLTQVLELTDGKRLQSELLAAVVEAFLKQDPQEAGKLGTHLETLLRKASLVTGWRPEFWLLYASLQRQLKQPSLAKEGLLKCFRHLQGTTWKTEPSQFSLLVRVIQELIQTTAVDMTKGDFRSLCLQLRGILKQAERIYIDSSELETLRALHSEALSFSEDAL